MSGLWSKRGRGRKRSWQEEDIKYLEICLEKDERTYNAAQLSQKLACIARSDFKQRSSQKSPQKAVPPFEDKRPRCGFRS